jgi:hypothetical protein
MSKRKRKASKTVAHSPPEPTIFDVMNDLIRALEPFPEARRRIAEEFTKMARDYDCLPADEATLYQWASVVFPN